MTTSGSLMVTAGTAAVANVVEDGFDVSGAGTAFFAGIVGTLLVLLVAAAGLAVCGARVLALVPLATVIGMVNLERAGGLLVLIAWRCLALSLPSAPKMAAQGIQRSPEQS